MSIDFSRGSDQVNTHRSDKRIIRENWISFFFIADALVLLVTGDILARSLPHIPGEAIYSGRSPIITASVGLLLYWMFAYSFGLYSVKVALEFQSLAQRITLTLAVAMGATLLFEVAAGTSLQPVALARVLWPACAAALLLAIRYVALRHVRRRLVAGNYVDKAVSIALLCEPLSGETIRAFTNSTVKIAHTVQVNTVSELLSRISVFMREEIDRVYIVVSWVDAPLILEQLTQLRRFSTNIYVIPYEDRIQSNHLGIAAFGNNTSITAVDRPIDGWGLWLKRVQDIVLASILIWTVAPLIVTIGMAVKLESPGPIFFKQRREGFNGTYFELWKFRSMYAEMSDLDAVRQTSRQDPRVTRVGRIIRRTSLDELPQLFNVLQGDMSIVGPRPHASQTRAEGRALDDIAEQYAARHRVKPGLTGWAQVNGFRGELDTVDKVRRRVAYDIEYIENWSTYFDIKIIMKTAWLVFHDPAAF